MLKVQSNIFALLYIEGIPPNRCEELSVDISITKLVLTACRFAA